MMTTAPRKGNQRNLLKRVLHYVNVRETDDERRKIQYPWMKQYYAVLWSQEGTTGECEQRLSVIMKIPTPLQLNSLFFKPKNEAQTQHAFLYLQLAKAGRC